MTTWVVCVCNGKHTTLSQLKSNPTLLCRLSSITRREREQREIKSPSSSRLELVRLELPWLVRFSVAVALYTRRCTIWQQRLQAAQCKSQSHQADRRPAAQTARMTQLLHVVICCETSGTHPAQTAQQVPHFRYTISHTGQVNKFMTKFISNIT